MVKKQKKISNCNKVKGKKWGLKILSFGLLGVMLASTGLFGLGHATTQAQTTQGGSTLADGGAIDNSFNLHPETDPVIYTTESGLDIKVSLAIDANGVFTGYTYFTMGKYNGADVNWLIIGRHSQTTAGTATTASYSTSLANFFSTTSPVRATTIKNWINAYYENNSPQGKAIADDMANDEIFVKQEGSYSANITFSSKEKINDNELEPGEVLCMSQYSVGSVYHNNNSYEGSTLQTYMNNLFTTNLGFTEEQQAIIVPKTLITRNTYSYLCFLFPLAYNVSNCNFNLGSYLSFSQQAGDGFGFRGFEGLSQYYVYRGTGSDGGTSYNSFELVAPSAGNRKTKACFVMNLL